MANKTYNKHAVLAYLFDMKTNCGTQHIGEDIDFTLREVGEGIRATGGATPTSWSNFVLDLTRKRNTIAQRLPSHVIQYGYDLRKKTGPVPGGQSGDNYCGTFVYRGFDANGQTIPIQDWLEWGIPDREVTIVNKVPLLVQKFISNDEASLFSVIDYCDILSQILGQTVQRVQSPMKWQPNEIDGSMSRRLPATSMCTLWRPKRSALLTTSILSNCTVSIKRLSRNISAMISTWLYVLSLLKWNLPVCYWLYWIIIRCTTPKGIKTPPCSIS